MNFSDIKESLRKLNEKDGYSAAVLDLDRGLCPHLTEPDKGDWERGYDLAKGIYSVSYDYYDIVE